MYLWVVFLGVLVGLTLPTAYGDLLPPPQILFMTSNEFNFGANFNSPNITKIGNRRYKVPPGMQGCVLVCNATYPITWKFHNAHFVGHSSWMLSIRTRRTAKDIYDITTYNYTAMLNIYGNYNRLTGNYTCAHAARESLQSSVYIFWQDYSQRKFIRSNETVIVYAEDNVAILPCISANPDFRDPVVHKVDGNSPQLVSYNNSVKFSRRRGVILDNVPYITGNYTCRPNGNNPNQEFMSVQVKLRGEKDPSGWLPSEKSNATLTWDPVTSKIKCCSSSRRSPVMMHYYCNHPTMCDFRKKFVVPDIYSTRLRKKSRRGCSTVKVSVHSGGLVHCVGDGINSFQQYTFSLRNWYLPRQNVTAYFDWSEINPHDMMSIQMNSYYGGYYRRGKWGGMGYPQTSSTVYNGQMLSFYCYTSDYFFSEGMRWAIKYKNNTIQIRDMVTSYGNNYRYEYANNGFYLTAHVDMVSVMCIAPVWNSTEFIHKPYPLYVNVSMKPVMNETLEETFTWKMNETMRGFNCSAFGIPIPVISWQKLDDWVRFLKNWHPSHVNVNHTQSVNNVTNVTTERVTIEIVSYTTNGTYICTATNFGGSVTRKIHIIVEEPPSWKKSVAIIVGLVLSIMLLIGVILVSWRLRAEKRHIRNLSTAVTFKDGNIRPEPPAAFEPLPHEVPVVSSDDYSNAALDPSKFSANLID